MWHDGDDGEDDKPQDDNQVGTAVVDAAICDAIAATLLGARPWTATHPPSRTVLDNAGTL